VRWRSQKANSHGDGGGQRKKRHDIAWLLLLLRENELSPGKRAVHRFYGSGGCAFHAQFCFELARSRNIDATARVRPSSWYLAQSLALMSPSIAMLSHCRRGHIVDRQGRSAGSRRMVRRRICGAVPHVAPAVCPWRSRSPNVDTDAFSGMRRPARDISRPVISGTLVSRYSFTSTPRSHRQASVFGEGEAWPTPIPTMTRSASACLRF